MAKFEGYLLKFGDTVFPEKYMAIDSYDSTDNQRTELKASRNAANLLIRQTSPNFKTKIEFDLIEGLHLKQWAEIKAVIDGVTLSRRERKVQVKYWCSEDLCYKTMTSYMPDIKFSIAKHTDNDIIYKSIRIALIEY